MKNEKQINFCRRWRPDFRYVDDKMEDVTLDDWKQKEPSVTDKEAYRVTLATLRGQLAQGSGKIDAGHYSLKPGESYNPSADLSFMYRPDLTIVELDERIADMTARINAVDGELAEQVKSELAALQQKRNELQISENRTEEGDGK